MRKSALIILVILALGLPNTVFADYPEHPIKIVVTFGPGGTNDTLARMLSKRMEEYLGKPILILNKGGAGGGIACAALKNTKPDGYTIGFGIATALTLNPNLQELEYSLDDFTMICSIAPAQVAIVSKTDSEWSNWQEMLDVGKKKGGLIVASTSPIDNLFFKAIEQKSNIKFTLLPAKGGADMVSKVLGGHVDLGTSGGIHYKYVQSGKMQVVASAMSERLINSPEVPTLQELGYDDLDYRQYTMLFARKGITEEAIEKITNAVGFALKDKNVIDLIENKVGYPIIFYKSEEMEKRMKAMNQYYKKLIDTYK